jgi:DNA polymerase/3'-5' exonuclease PolX
MSEKLPLGRAEKFAAAIRERLKPFCERVMICGSVRRGAELCGDIDIVAIPQVRERKDLLGNVIERQSFLRDELLKWVRTGRARWRESLHGPAEEAEVYLLALAKCDLDVFIATPETWATRILHRTGSVAHNIWLCERAKALGGHWNPARGLTLHGVRVVATEEKDIYAALGLPCVHPFQRYPDFLKAALKISLSDCARVPLAGEKGNAVSPHAA